MECRPAASSFDIAASAGWYSAIAGVLAGFALLSILLPLDHAGEDADESETADAVSVFTCAFFSLLILSFSYAVLAGRTGGTASVGLAAHEQLLNGAALGLTTLMLLFGLHAVLGSYGRNRRVFRPAQRIIVTTTSVLGPCVLLALQFSNALDLQRSRADVDGAEAQCSFGGLPDAVWVDLGITVVAIAGVLVLAVTRRRLPRSRGATTVAAKGVLGFTFAVVAWSALVLPLFPESTVTGAAFEHVTLAATGVATVAVAAASWISRS